MAVGVAIVLRHQRVGGCQDKGMGTQEEKVLGTAARVRTRLLAGAVEGEVSMAEEGADRRVLLGALEIAFSSHPFEIILVEEEM